MGLQISLSPSFDLHFPERSYRMKQEVFVTIKIKKKTAAQFRTYSRGMGKQQSETLQLMLDFFQNNQLSPLEELGPNLLTLEKKLKVRINAVVAIIRDIEKSQTKPTLAMLQLLFQESPVKKEVLVEKNKLAPAPEEYVHEQLHKKIETLETRLSRSRRMTEKLLGHVAISRSSFGKVQLRLLMTQNEFQEIKEKLQNI